MPPILPRTWPSASGSRGWLDFGLAKEAAEVFRDVIQDNDRDADAYTGLAEAQFAAKVAYQKALNINPADESVRKKLEYCEEIFEFDPGAARLEHSKRYQRSRSILAAAVDRAKGCKEYLSRPATAQEGLQESQKELVQRRKPRSYAQVAESNMSLAKVLWSTLRLFVAQNRCLPIR